MRIPKAQISSGPGWVTLKFQRVFTFWVATQTAQIMPPAAARLPRRSSFLMRITESYVSETGRVGKITYVLCHMAHSCLFYFANAETSSTFLSPGLADAGIEGKAAVLVTGAAERQPGRDLVLQLDHLVLRGGHIRGKGHE